MFPSASTTTPESTTADASAFGAAIAPPFASRQIAGAKYSVPSGARTVHHGEYRAPAEGTTHRPGDHHHRCSCHVHSPSIHTTPFTFGRAGACSTRAGGGSCAIGTSAPLVCATYTGRGIDDEPHAVTAADASRAAT